LHARPPTLFYHLSLHDALPISEGAVLGVALPRGDLASGRGVRVTLLRVAIVDDEMPARQVLREYLGAEPGVEIVAECANGFEAVKAVAEKTPHLLLLDVQMPKLDGFEVLELVGRETAVNFTTAYDQYALRAFEVHAIDYLLKPFSRERLQEALARARTWLARGPAVKAAP